MKEINIPVGISDFAEIRKENLYYIDKSGLIEELLRTRGTKVTLITRPRRFGKTLGMSMLAEFFDIRKDSRELFDGLSVAQNQELCQNWMNQFPTLFLSFKDIGADTFENASGMLRRRIAKICIEHAYLAESKKVADADRASFQKLMSSEGDTVQIKNGLETLCRMMHMHYEKPVVLLLDEYDVPIAKAAGHDGQSGYYAQMMDVISPLIGTAVKDNSDLKFAVLTGCLRLAKESIFTGTNNFVSDTISDSRLNEYFGFTQAEVDRLLADTKLTSHTAEMKTWYDGYHFGGFDVYCPWDVMNHVNSLLLDPHAAPAGYWENTSHNDIIRSFLDRTQFDVNDKFEILLSGGYITEPLEERLTYNMLTSSEENLWTLLYFTGYLTKVKDSELPLALPRDRYALRIPNAELMEVFRKSVKEWFNDRSAGSDRRELFCALWKADTEKLTGIISDILFDTISYHDYRESFYHAFLTGLFSKAGYQVASNYENGLGRSDIVIKDRKNRQAAVIEAKVADSESRMESECVEALRQIEERQYARTLERSGYRRVTRLGICFWQKQCLVRKAPTADLSE